MAILAVCPECKCRQSLKHEFCRECGVVDMKKAIRSRRVLYYIKYRGPDGKQILQSVAKMKDMDGYSITDARAADAKRKVQKKEHPDLEPLYDRLLILFKDHHELNLKVEMFMRNLSPQLRKPEIERRYRLNYLINHFHIPDFES